MNRSLGRGVKSTLSRRRSFFDFWNKRKEHINFREKIEKMKKLMSSFCWFLRTCGNFGFLSQVNPNIPEIRSSSLLSLPPRFSKYYRKCRQAKLQVQMVLVFTCLKSPHQVMPNWFLGLSIVLFPLEIFHPVSGKQRKLRQFSRTKAQKMINKIIVQYRSFRFYPRSLRGICKTHFTFTFPGIICYMDYSLLVFEKKNIQPKQC